MMSSWSTEWCGTATDFMPDLLAISGKPGRIAAVATDAIWESIQKIGEQDVHAIVRVVAQGYDEKDSPGIGRFSIALSVEPEPSEIQRQLEAQQPVDLLRPTTPTTTE